MSKGHVEITLYSLFKKMHKNAKWHPFYTHTHMHTRDRVSVVKLFSLHKSYNLVLMDNCSKIFFFLLMADVFLKNYAYCRKFGKSPRTPNYARLIAHIRDTYCFKGEHGIYKFSTKEVLSERFNRTGI